MGEVTIDSIQIEIESNSTGAVRGLDALAGSLEKLKKNGSFKTVSTNLNNLSTALKNLPNVHSAANSLRTLANSIEKLKGVGSVSSLTTSLNKLPAALKSVSGINLDRVAPQIQKVADTVAPLSNIKAGGLNTMVNSMKKLDEVTKSLDDATIQRFANKVGILNEKLAPLATKMTSIKAGFNAINSSARKAADGVKDFGEGINASALNMTSFIEIAKTIVSAVSTIIQKLTEYIHQAAQWDGVKYQFGNAFGEQADIYYEKINKITEALNINKQAFMENSAMAASMLIGFGVDKKDAREMGLGYTQLAYDIWAAYNNVYETLDGADGAMAAVRSAIAGEVEPIRRAGFTIVEATLEQTAANHGLDISLQNATEAQKSYLRYLELVDQAQRKGVVGTYAREMETAEGMMRTFSQQLKSLAQAFGSLFLPVLVKVMPYIQAFVELLQDGVFWLAALFGIEIQDIGDTWNDFSSGVGSGAGALDGVADSAGGATGALEDATKAAKELKNATLGIDELNVISPSASADSGGSGGGSGGSGGGAGGGFAGLDIDSLWDESIFDGIQQDVDKIKEKMQGWLPIIGTVATALAGLRLNKFLKDIKAIEATKFFSGKVKDFFAWIKTFRELAKEGGLVATLAAAFPKLSKVVATATGNLSAFFALAKEGGVIAALSAAFPGLSNAIAGVGTFLAGISAPVWAAIAAAVIAVGSAIYFVIENWDALKKAVKEFFNENIAPKFEEIGKSFDKMKEALGPIYDNFILPIIEGIKFLVADLSWLGEIFEWLGGIVVGILGGVVGGAINALVQLLQGAVEMISGVVQILSGIVGGLINLVVGLFTGDFSKALDSAKLIWDGIVSVFSGAYDATIGVVVAFVEGIISWFTKMWDILVGHSIVPDTVNAIVEWFTSLPGKIFGSIETFVSGIVGKFQGLWDNLVKWWNSKPKLSEYVPSIGDIGAKLSAAWESAKTWWSKKTALSTYTPSIGKIWEKLKSAWDSVITWWNKKTTLSTYTPSIGKIWEKLKAAWESVRTWWSKKTKLSTYTPSIGSISSKLSSAWSSAKTWWGKKSGLSSYTPSIGSIKDKLSSAWSTAKSWWSRNVGNLSTKINVQVPTISVKWATAEAFGKSFKYPTGFSLKFAADGGIFDAGSLIWAGERGAEIVANAGGGKTGVMNVQQMQDAVYEGVYAAMVAAMRGNGEGSGSQVIKVYLDGKEITHSVEQHQRERGASIMGNEVYSY